MINVPHEIKNLLHQDTCPKNIRIHFPNGERSDICNDLIVMDTVSLKESLCSQNNFVFGLAESPIFECETVGVGNIKGAYIIVYCEVFCPSTVSGAVWRTDIQQWVYPIEYGRFTVSSCDRQADLLHRKILAYGFVQDLYEGLAAVEVAKMRFKTKQTSFSYTPSGFLFSLANLGLTKVDPNVFTATSISQSSTSDSIKNQFVWTTIGGTVLHAELYVTSAIYTISASDADNLYKFAYTQKNYKNAVTLFYTYLSQFCQYRQSKDYIRQYIDLDQLAYEITWSSTNSKYVGPDGSIPTTRELLFYPYLNGNSVTVRIPISIKANVPISLNDGQRTVIDYDFVDGLTFYKYTQNFYNILNSFRLTFTCSDGYSLTYNGEFSNRKIFEDCLKLIGCFAYYTDGYISIINIQQQFTLLPDEDLYPGDDVYPEGDVGASIRPQDYQSCWYDENYTKQYGVIRVYYTDNYNNASVVEWWIGEFDSDTPTDMYSEYLIDEENVLIKSAQYAEYIIQQLCQNIEENIKGVTWIPVKLVGRGLPYVKPGDTFEVLTTSGDSITTIVLNRTIKGEMVLTDEYSSVS